MKVLVVCIFVFCLAFTAEAQLIIDRPEPEAEQLDAEHNLATFVPHPRLLDKERWTRVSDYRFECRFLRLAVEFRNHNYVLIEMDGEKRVLARSIDYDQITQRIIELTINPRPNSKKIH